MTYINVKLINVGSAEALQRMTYINVKLTNVGSAEALQRMTYINVKLTNVGSDCRWLIKFFVYNMVNQFMVEKLE